MDFLIGWQNYETEFNGQKVTMQLRSLKRDAHMVLMSQMSAFGTVSSQEEKEVDFETAEKMAKLVDNFAPFFGEYVRGIEGFTVNGQPPTPEMIVDEAAFATLAMDIISQLSVITTLSQADEKN